MTTDPGAYVKKFITCKRCGAGHLAWSQSSKTGRFYLCETYPSQDDEKRLSGVRWAAPWVPHNCKEVQS